MDSLRALGANVPYVESGPFRAVADGNRFVAGLGLRLMPVKYHDISNGNYVLWRKGSNIGHFTAVKIDTTVREIDGSRLMAYDHIRDMGEPSHMKWFQLIANNVIGSPGVSQAQLLELRARRTRAAIHRSLQTRPDRSRPYDAAAPPSHSGDPFLTTSGLTMPSPPDGWAHPSEPLAPTDFRRRLDLPSVDYLKSIHPHDMDSHIQFYEGPHSYYVDGEQTLGSVTGLIHRFSVWMRPV